MIIGRFILCCKNNTDESYMFLIHFPPMVTSCRTVISQETHTDTVCWPFPLITSFICTHVLVFLCNFIRCRAVWPQSQPRYRTVPSQTSFVLPFNWCSHLPTFLPWFLTTTTTVHLISMILSFQVCYINGII